MIQFLEPAKPHKGGFAESKSNIQNSMSQTAIMERLVEEIQLLAKDSKNFEQQYKYILKYYRELIGETAHVQ